MLRELIAQDEEADSQLEEKLNGIANALAGVNTRIGQAEEREKTLTALGDGEKNLALRETELKEAEARMEKAEEQKRESDRLISKAVKGSKNPFLLPDRSTVMYTVGRGKG